MRALKRQKRSEFVLSTDYIYGDNDSPNIMLTSRENVEYKVELRLFIQELLHGQYADNLEKDIIKDLMYGLSPSEICKKRDINWTKINRARKKAISMYYKYSEI